MATVVEVIHVLLSIALIGLVLIQKSEGGGLGIGGGGGGGMSGFMTSRGQANLLTRITAILFFCVILTSIGLTVLHTRAHNLQPSLIDQLPLSSKSEPGPASSSAPAPMPAQPPAQPSVPLAK